MVSVRKYDVLPHLATPYIEFVNSLREAKGYGEVVGELETGAVVRCFKSNGKKKLKIQSFSLELWDIPIELRT